MAFQKTIERVVWAIKHLREKGRKWPELTENLGATDETLRKYMEGTADQIVGSVIDGLVNYYNFDPVWLIKGAGEPFPEATDQYPEVFGREATLRGIREKSAPYDDTSDETSHLLKLTRSILISRSEYASALAINIRSFYKAVLMEYRFRDLEERVTTLETQQKENDARLTKQSVATGTENKGT